MILIGYPKIGHSHFALITSTEEIGSTPNNAIVVFDWDIDIASFCGSNGVPFAPIVKSRVEAVLAENLSAVHLICDKSLAPSLQELAEHYLFDAKILALIDGESEIEECIEHKIDGVIFREVIYGKS